jgi:hypothetical protein
MPRGFSVYEDALIQRRLWTPDLLRPAVWLDASDIRTVILSGSNVTQWNDKSGNERNMTVGGNAPAIANNSLNGLNTILFDNRSATQTLVNSYSYSGNDITLFSLARSSRLGGRTNFPRLWSMNATGQTDFGNTAGLLMLYGVGSPNNASMFRNNAVMAQSPQNTNDQWALHIGTKSGGSATFSSNGETRAVGSTSNTPFGFNFIRIGNDTSASDSGLFGNVAETGILPFAVTLKEEQQLAGYILWRWGLTGLLPAAHPFRNRPPLIGD